MMQGRGRKRFWRQRAALIAAVTLVGILPGGSAAVGAPSESKLVFSTGAADDRLGNPVAVSQNWLVAGKSAAGADFVGSVVVFEPDGHGGWIENAEIVPADGAAGDWFGSSVAVVGNRIVVGSPNDDDGGSNSGSAYVFEPDGVGGWAQVAKLTASDAQINAHFGDVAATGNRIVVGAPSHDNIGKAYVFHRDSILGWVETATLVPPGEFFHHDFGRAVATVGNRIAVAGPSFEFANDPAAVYVFEDDGFGGWSQVAKLQASDGAENCFGVEIAMIPDEIAVGDPCGSDPEAAYVYRRSSGGTWVETRLTSPDAGQEGFGEGIALTGGRLVVGATGMHNTLGAAYVYAPDGAGGWYQVAKLTASDGTPGHSFGSSVAVLGNSIFVGAPLADSYQGAVYVYDMGRGLAICTVTGTPGNDTLTGSAAADVICGLGGNDTIYGLGGDDLLRGGGGRDRIFGGAGNDTILGQGGNDVLRGGSGNDWISGGTGKDTIRGQSGKDRLRGDGGADRIHPGPGTDIVNGGSGGNDWVMYTSAGHGVEVSLLAGAATGQGPDVLKQVENVAGSRFADRLIGNGAANEFAAGAGADAVWGRGGDDLMIGGRGRDLLRGGAGDDEARGGAGADTCFAEVQVSC